MFIDTHCHLDMILAKKNLTDLEELLPELGDQLEKMIHIACDAGAFAAGIAFAEKYENIYLGMGVHPHDAKDYNSHTHQKLIDFMQHPKVVAWGECGLDYHYDNSPREIQKSVFIQQIRAAQKLAKPLIIHTRDAEADTLEILQKELSPNTKVHVHCFTSHESLALELLKLSSNIYFGFTGVLTFKSAQDIRDTVKKIPLEKILLETDSPFMAPKPFRGKPCHPGMVPYIAQEIATLKNEPLEKLFLQCRANTQKMYGI